MDFKTCILFLLIQICGSQSDTKWVWSRERKPDTARVISSDTKRYNAELVGKPLFEAHSDYNNNNNNNERQSADIRYRYEVTEDVSDFTTYRPRPTEHYRPDPDFIRPTNAYRPDYVRPTNGHNEYETGLRPHENGFYSLGNGYRPTNGDYSTHGLRPGIGTDGRPILTGPVPSWQETDHHNYKDYDICKCVHSFNCNTPGIKFGTCDTDKQYCCYKKKNGDVYGNGGRPIGVRPDRPRPRPILAGPGGPVDPPHRPHQNKGGTPVRPREDLDEALNNAYKKGLASALHNVKNRPEHYDRYQSDRYSDRYQSDRYSDRYPDRYSNDREYYTSFDTKKSSHPSKYGLYFPTVGSYARSANSTILAAK